MTALKVGYPRRVRVPSPAGVVIPSAIDLFRIDLFRSVIVRDGAGNNFEVLARAHDAVTGIALRLDGRYYATDWLPQNIS